MTDPRGDALRNIASEPCEDGDWRALALRFQSTARDALAADAVGEDRPLAKIADLAKYLAEPAWNLEGCALVGRQIYKLATGVALDDPLPGSGGGVEEDRLTAETLICCDHAHVADPACGLNGDGIATLGELIAAYDSSDSDAVGEDRPCRCSQPARYGHSVTCSSSGGVEPSREEPDFGEDNSGHDTDCNCKACLIDTWHAEVEELRRYASSTDNPLWDHAWAAGNARGVSRAKAAEARVVELEAALRDAHYALRDAGESGLPARNIIAAALAAAGEGDDRRPAYDVHDQVTRLASVLRDELNDVGPLGTGYRRALDDLVEQVRFRFGGSGSRLPEQETGVSGAVGP